MSEKTENTEYAIEKAYEPSTVEARWAQVWINERLATPDAASEKPAFSMVIPPPNITGALHLGHALNSTLQDILARTRRMQGYNVLWLPGIDHAGIATQNVVERQLAAEGTDRHSLGREAFIERVWKWKNESGGTIINQLKRLGASCDWTRLRFTMDEGLSKAVREVFTRLYGDGLIYQGDYIINWCPRCHTALSDLEVEISETEGSLWYIEYPLAEPAGGVKSLTVATTRPETMLGDTAVAVNPEDERYKGLIGKKIRLPFVEREIPVIGDDSVSIEFGTGAVKITPAHDFNDFEVGRRHGLPSIKIMDESGRMNANAGPFAGLDRFDARKKVVDGLEEKGLLQKIDKHKLMLGGCYRCSTVVEPTLSKQWFVKVAPLAEPAIKAVEDGRTRFVPRNWENLYFDWMRNIRDWCISRQIWWGHRIPAWHCKDCKGITVASIDPDKCSKCGSTNIEQDPDVLDTWFSSALWPFSTLGWPDKTKELEKFYPTSVLSTSFDIIFFWVARMMMMGLKFMDDVPFKDVYIHALIRDAKGQKMSKKKRNECIKEVNAAIDGYRFDEAARALYRFVWHELCDWYVELVKLDLRGEHGPERKLTAQQALVTVMRDTMKLLHPFMPFITEEIAEKLPGYEKSLMVSEFPKEGTAYREDAGRMEDVMDIIRAVRNIRTDMNVAPSAFTDCVCYTADAGLRAVLSTSEEYIKTLARIKGLVIAETGERPKYAVSALAGGGEQKKVEVFVPLGGLVDFDVEEKRLAKELEKSEVERSGVAKKLDNKEFTDKAPAEVVEKDRARLEALDEKIAKLNAGLARIRSIRA